MCKFNCYVGIDYSGAATPTTRLPGLQVYAARRGDEQPAPIRADPREGVRKRHWSRNGVFEYLRSLLSSPQAGNCLVGIDHAFSFPDSYFRRLNLASWDDFLGDLIHHWPCDREGTKVEDWRKGNSRCGDAKELRRCETWTSGAKSVFQFDVQGSVAKSTHAGLPFLHKLRQQLPQLHFWPFDGWEVPEGRSVIAETWPSLFRNRYARRSISSEEFESSSACERGDASQARERSVDEQDAYATARWMLEMDRIGELDRFFLPPLSPSQLDGGRLEGWILGVT